MLKVVVDANVLISAVFAPEGPVADTLWDARGKVDLLSPALIAEEIELHVPRIAMEIGTDPHSIRAAFARLISLLRIIPVDTIPRSVRGQADVLAGTIDPKDVAYVALALSQQAVLWTLDRKLTKALTKKDVGICIDTFIMRSLIQHA